MLVNGYHQCVGVEDEWGPVLLVRTGIEKDGLVRTGIEKDGGMSLPLRTGVEKHSIC